MRHYWLDRVELIEPHVRAVGVKAVSLAEDHFEAHFPGNPVLPGVVLVEALAQLAGVLVAESFEFTQLSILTSVDRARFQAFVRPGDQVRLEVEAEAFESGFARIRGSASVGDTAVCTARLTLKLVSPDWLIAPAYQPFWRQTIQTWLRRHPEPTHA